MHAPMTSRSTARATFRSTDDFGASSAVPSDGGSVASARSSQAFPTLYAGVAALASLDVLFTSIILMLGGIELNAIAAGVHRAAGMPGMAAFKIGCVLTALGCIEYLRRARPELGWRVGEWAIGLSLIPVAVGGAQVLLVGAQVALRV